MDLKNVPILPEPYHQVFGNADKNVNITGEWKIVSNCPSDRLKQHLFNTFTHFQKESVDIKYQLTLASESNAANLLNVYPIGLVSPRAPFYLIISPSSLNINSQVVLKTIKWKTEWNAKDYRTTDEYHLLISNFIQITARCERGLFYGLKTLEQLFDTSGNHISFQTIHDFPQLSLRAIHIDLKFFRPHQNYLLWQMRTLAGYKINCVFIEWEDKFPFSEDLQFIAHQAALTIEEKDELLKVCSENYIEVVPIIQSLGHYGYVLKHPNWQHLREHPAKPRKDYMMFCPSHPETENAILKIHKQIVNGMGEHAASHFIHLGLDECYYLGECPKCAANLGSDPEAGKSKMFIDWLNKVAAHYLQMGKRPIVWHDMLVRHPQLIDQLNPQIIICDWEYEHPVPKQFPPFQNIDPTGQSVDWVRTWDQKTLEMIEKNPPITTPYFLDQCWRFTNGKYPLTAFPYTKYFRHRKFDVLAAPASQFGKQTPAGPRYDIHIPNIMFFNLTAIRNNCIGSICTNWVVRETPWPLIQFGFLLHAETCWSGKLFEEDQFAQKYWIQFYRIKMSTETESLTQNLTRFYSQYSIYGLSYSNILKLLNEPLPTTEYHSKDEILNEFPEKMRKFEPYLNDLRSMIKSNIDHFTFLQIFYKYWVFLSEWLTIAYSLENIAQSLDESASFGVPDLDHLQNLSDRLSVSNQKWFELIEIIKPAVKCYLHPFEETEFLNRLINPITEHLQIFMQKYPILIENLQSFIESVLDSMMHRT
jgi:hypothetical protein